MGLAPLQHACKDIVKDYMDSTHPLALTKEQQEQLETVTGLTNEEYTQNVLDLSKLACLQGLHKLNRDLQTMPTVKVPEMIEKMQRIIRDIQGQPSQRIEVTKKNLSPEEFNKMLDGLVEAKVIKDG